LCATLANSNSFVVAQKGSRMTTALYKTDFHAWTQQQALFLRQEDWEKLDWFHLAEEVESMGRSEQRELGSRLQVLLMHLLKWQFQPDHHSSSWEATIIIQRIDLAELLQENPSLRPCVGEFVTAHYRRALLAAMIETGLHKRIFPATCPYTVEQILDEEFWP
jgi:hypothetical protein